MAYSTSRVPVGRLRDEVVARGVGALSLDDIVAATGLSRAAATEAMRRLRRAGQFFAPAPGLYIPIPSEYSGWGVVPAMDFIDQLMTFLGRSYYVAMLSAAELHGAAHQRPQVFQVTVDRIVSDRDIARVRLRFYRSARLGELPYVLKNSRTARVRVSPPEATVFDLAARPRDSGGLFNVATVVGELADDQKLDADALVDAADTYPLAVVRRVGWLLDRSGEFVDTADLADRLHEFVVSRSDPHRRVVDLLDSAGRRRGATNMRWGLVENTEVEPDL